MKTSSIVASVLFGSMAAAAPMLNKRAYVTHTQTLIQTEVTYTTVYADEVAAKASKTNAAFFEQTKRPSGPSAPVSTKPVSSVAPVQASSIVSSRPSSSAVPPPPPAPTTSQAVPKTTSPAPVVQPTTSQPPVVQPTTSKAPVVQPSSVVAPVAAPSSVAAPKASASSAPSTGATGGGETHSGGSLTMHPFGGDTGACGEKLNDSQMVVALAKDVWGESTHDVMTGKATNKYCGMNINITYNGKTAPAKIMDLCDGGCTNGGLDVSKAVWAQLGAGEYSRLTGMTWSPA